MLLTTKRLLWVLLVATLPASAASLRDPTMPPAGVRMGSAAEALPSAEVRLQLNSIVTGATGKHAVINNQIYHVGDSVNGVVISAIHDNQVSLADGRRLSLFPTVTKQNKKR
ncbi:MSHA biogenesis protein MshK [Shewanella avicenniae]|uniref:MSHA biogenesis protein MshK n=1 Tax=Shewanella avicenniae TaxID=2814294 RepID=A0ABX7QQE4_9GAMM|nr:MSHA biogenesis protein MshK [Shewanella avicenniae]QSX33247.1 MSHA biogenesis protein MshK [Shewanella avicenniae]